MKKAIIGLVFCGCAVAATAQIRRTMAPKPKADSVAVSPNREAEGGDRKGKIKALDLDKQQKSKLRGVMQSAKQEKEAIENDEKLSESEKRQKLQALRKRQMAHLDSVLTPEQKQKLIKTRQDALRQKRAAKQGAKNRASETEMKQEQ